MSQEKCGICERPDTAFIRDMGERLCCDCWAIWRVAKETALDVAWSVFSRVMEEQKDL